MNVYMDCNKEKTVKTIFLQEVTFELKQDTIKYTKIGFPHLSSLDPKLSADNAFDFHQFELRVLKPLIDKVSLDFVLKLTFTEEGDINYDEIYLEFCSKNRFDKLYISDLVRHVTFFKGDMQGLDIYTSSNLKHNISVRIQTDADAIEDYIKEKHFPTSLKMVGEIKSLLQNCTNPAEKTSIPIVAGHLQLPQAQTRFAYSILVKEIGNTLSKEHE